MLTVLTVNTGRHRGHTPSNVHLQAVQSEATRKQVEVWELKGQLRAAELSLAEAKTELQRLVLLPARTPITGRH